jgi:hypothetical protein
MAELFVGVDTGGTFTDLVLLQEGEIRVHKVLSTPDDPSRAILQGLSDLGVRENLSTLVHGSTVATNAVLEHKGVRTGLKRPLVFVMYLRSVGRHAQGSTTSRFRRSLHWYLGHYASRLLSVSMNAAR